MLVSETPRDIIQVNPARRLLVIYNPVAGQRHGSRLRATFRALEHSGASLSLIETNGPGDAEQAALRANRAETDIVIAAGGDGTINEVVNGLMAAAAPIPALGLIPLGTANVLAQEIGLKLGPDKIVSALLGGQIGRAHV